MQIPRPVERMYTKNFCEFMPRRSPPHYHNCAGCTVAATTGDIGAHSDNLELKLVVDIYYMGWIKSTANPAVT